MGDVVPFRRRPVYRIAYKWGEFEEYVTICGEVFECHDRWEAEDEMFVHASQWPGLWFWLVEN